MSTLPQALGGDRIYVGGIDPDRLSVDQVLERVEKELAEKSWELQKVHEGSCYFQFQAFPVGNSSPDNSPLDLTKKLFHNVKWKGCKLSVEPAKPHFLERLKQEREALSKNQTLVNLDSEQKSEQIPQEECGISHLANPPKRFYKIRRGFGETVWRVDTKPYQVDSFTGFRKLRSKLERQKRDLEQQQKSQHSPKGKKQKQSNSSKTNTRAIHMRFDESIVAGAESVPPDDSYYARLEMKIKPDDEASVLSTGSSPSESDERLESNHDDEENNMTSNKTYQWSDEDSDNRSSTEGSIDDEVDETETSSKDPMDTKTIPQTSPVNEALSYSSEEERDESKTSINQQKVTSLQQEEPTSETNQIPLATETQSGEGGNDDSEPSSVNHSGTGGGRSQKYVWSDDESSSSEVANDDEALTQNYQMKERWNPMDEFAMGDNGDEVDFRKDIEASNFEDEKTSPVNTNLDEEANANQSILAQLFPELSGTKRTSEGASANKSQENSSWPSSRQMLRFDPTQLSAQKYILEKETQIQTTSDAEEDESDSDDIETHHDGEANIATNEEQVVAEDSSKGEAVYRQDALETVFKEAREAESEVVVLDTEEEAAQTGFSFSFSVGDTPQKPQEKSSSAPTDGFSFSFDFQSKSQAEPTVSNSIDEQKITSKGDAGSDMVDAENKARRRYGLGIPSEDLSNYVRSFLEYDDGKRIIEDPQGYKKDPTVQAKWEEERKVLTHDWKRKRKLAVSRRGNSGHRQYHRYGGGH